MSVVIKKYLLWLGYYGLLALLPVSVAKADIVSAIEFEGNDVTKESVFLQEMQTKVGDEFDLEKLKSDIQAIMDLGLFRNVDYSLSYTDQIMSGNVAITISVHEKYFLFVLPRIRYDDDEGKFHWGVSASWNNIGGLNRHLTYKLSEHGKTLGVLDLREKLTFSMPRLNGSPYNLDFYTQNREAVVGDVYDNPQNRKEHVSGIDLFRWFNPKRQSSGWYAGAGIFQADYRNDAFYSGMPSSDDHQGDFLSLKFGFQRINEYLFNRRGKDYGIIIDTTRFLFDNDEHSVRYQLFYRSYYRLKSNPMNNLNVQVRAEVSEGNYLGDVAFSLGRSSLRGYEAATYTGNALFAMNIEYLMPFDRDPAYRYGYIMDLGNTYERGEEMDLTHLHPSVGVAFRWKLAAFVKVDLRIDIAYGIDEDSFNLLAGTRHVF